MSDANEVNEINEFKFYKHFDSDGYDLFKANTTNVKELMKLCINNDRCVGFNTLGYLKYYIADNLNKLPQFKKEVDGLYVYDSRWNDIVNKNKEKNYLNFDDYIFYPNKDSHGYDLQTYDININCKKSIKELKEISDADESCKGFNTLGYFKSNIVSEINFCPFRKGLYSEGLYVKKLLNKQNQKLQFNTFNRECRIKCINLKRRDDRKQIMMKLLDNTRLLQYCDFVEAVDGKSLKATEYIKKIFTGNDHNNRKSVIGCALSHLNLWKELLLDNTYESYLILEDDITFNFNDPVLLINEVFESLKNLRQWDIVYLGHHINKSFIKSYNQLYGKQSEITIIPHLMNITIGGLYGYIINKSGAKKLIDTIDKNGIKYAIDRIAYNYKDENKIKQYESVPRIIISDYVDQNNLIDSDIQYNYDPLF